MLEKNTEETMAEGDAIAKSLTRFAKQRGDIFGSQEDEEEAVLQNITRMKAQQQGPLPAS